jgi:hypothetical protein
MKNNMSWPVFFLYVFLCVAGMANTIAIPEYLVTGDNPSELEQRAESELQLFWNQLYGKELVKIPAADAEGKSTIFLGNTAFALENNIDCTKLDKEEWVLKTIADDLIIAGGRPAGVLYGVYEVLERLGVGFLSPAETVVPKTPEFCKFDERRKPVFDGRLIYEGVHGHLYRAKATPEAIDKYKLWLLRNRCNGQNIRHIEPYYIGGLNKMNQHPYWHSLSVYVNPDKYFAEHPEYFSMDAMGRRQKPRSFSFGGSLCMSNPDVRRITLENLRRMIKEDIEKNPPELRAYVYDISTLDASPTICSCPECRKITDYEGSETGLLLDYINHIAREIRKEYPQIIIRTFGYSASKTPPQKILPESNVLIQLTDSFSSRDPFRAITKVKDPDVLKYFKDWCSHGNPMMVWDYWNIGGTYFNPPRVETIFDSLQPDMRFFRDNGFKALFIEASMDSASPQNFMLLNSYVAYHLMVDPECDVEKLAKQYIHGYYGPAGPVMEKYFNAIRKGVAEDPQKPNSAVVAPWKYLTVEFVVGLYQDFHAEIDKMPKDSRFAQRVRQELISPIWFALANWPSYSKGFEAIGCTRAALLDECIANSKEFIRRFPSTKPEALDKYLENKIEKIKHVFERPEKFKDVPEKDFRMITHMDFRGVRNLGSGVVEDAESMYGKALKSADKRDEHHGINKLLPGKHGFRTTEFVLGNHKMPGRCPLVLKSIPTDEKYHWYRIPGSIELLPVSYFWGQGWAIQACTSHWYFLTDGNPLDNLWTQVWFSAKFTGPAYVPGSTKENAIYVEAAVITRNTPDEEFKEIEINQKFEGTGKDGKCPRGWELNGFYKNCGTALVQGDPGSRKVTITAAKDSPTVVQGPIIPCTNKDVIIAHARTVGGKCKVGLYYFKDSGFHSSTLRDAPNNDKSNEYVFDVSEEKDGESIARCRLVFFAPSGDGSVVIDEVQFKKADNLNILP